MRRGLRSGLMTALCVGSVLAGGCGEKNHNQGATRESLPEEPPVLEKVYGLSSVNLFDGGWTKFKSEGTGANYYMGSLMGVRDQSGLRVNFLCCNEASERPSWNRDGSFLYLISNFPLVDTELSEREVTRMSVGYKGMVSMRSENVGVEPSYEVGRANSRDKKRVLALARKNSEFGDDFFSQAEVFVVPLKFPGEKEPPASVSFADGVATSFKVGSCEGLEERGKRIVAFYDVELISEQGKERGNFLAERVLAYPFIRSLSGAWQTLDGGQIVRMDEGGIELTGFSDRSESVKDYFFDAKKREFVLGDGRSLRTDEERRELTYVFKNSSAEQLIPLRRINRTR